MKKKIKKWGGSLVIRFSPDDKEQFGIDEGVWIEIPDEALRKASKDNPIIQFDVVNKMPEVKNETDNSPKIN